MASFCNCCSPSNDTYLCQSCGSIKCAGMHRPKWLALPNAARLTDGGIAEGNVCPTCQTAAPAAPAPAMLAAQGWFARQETIYADACDIGLRIDGDQNPGLRRSVRNLIMKHAPKVSTWKDGRTYNFGGFEISWCHDRARHLEFLSYTPL